MRNAEPATCQAPSSLVSVSIKLWYHTKYSLCTFCEMYDLSLVATVAADFRHSFNFTHQQLRPRSAQGEATWKRGRQCPYTYCIQKMLSKDEFAPTAGIVLGETDAAQRRYCCSARWRCA